MSEVDETLHKKIPDHHFLGQHNLKVVGHVKRVAVMPRMAHVKHLKVDHSEKGEDAGEEGIQCFGLENSAMPQFVHGIDLEGVERTVEKNQWQDRPGWPATGGVKHRATGQDKQPKIAQGLEPAPKIAFFVQALEDFGVEWRPVPSDRARAGFWHGIVVRRFALNDFQSHAAVQIQT